MPSRAKKEKYAASALVAFQVDLNVNALLKESATRHGFTSASLYARAVLLEAIQQPEREIAMKRIAEMRLRIQKRAVTDVLNMFATYTEEDLLGGP